MRPSPVSSAVHGLGIEPPQGLFWGEFKPPPIVSPQNVVLFESGRAGELVSGLGRGWGTETVEVGPRMRAETGGVEGGNQPTAGRRQRTIPARRQRVKVNPVNPF